MKVCASAPLRPFVESGRGRESGYTLAMFVMVIAVMSIAMGVAVQAVSFQMQREREAELIFRGEQFIEAIRLYKIKYGRYPMQLKEIYEAKPRVIRKKWRDPITDSENWGIVFLGQEGQRMGQQGRSPVGGGAPGGRTGGGPRPIETHIPFGGPQQDSGGLRDQGGGETQRPGSLGGQPGQPGQSGLGASSFGEVGADRKMGPIVGVHSTSCDEAIKVYEGHTTYCEWRFIYREPQQRGGRGRPGQPPGTQPEDPRDKLPYGVPPGAGNPPGSGGPPGGNRPPRPIRTPRP